MTTSPTSPELTITIKSKIILNDNYDKIIKISSAFCCVIAIIIMHL
ncbi:hypothetical protein [Candidatus Tisiphia endosymbiont of Sialis lutaria]